MKFNKKAFVFFAATIFLAGSEASSHTTTITKLNDSLIKIHEGKNSRKIHLNITISEWRISCDGETGIIWGQTKNKLPTGVPPYTKIYIINTKNWKNPRSLTVSRGPFEVYFANHGTQVKIDEYTIEISSGNILNIIPQEKSQLTKDECKTNNQE